MSAPLRQKKVTVKQTVKSKDDMMVGEIKPQKTYKIVKVNDHGGYDPEYSVTFRITEACDLQCNYCHWHAGRHYKYEDIITSIDKLFEFFQKQKFRSVMFYYHGGEATRHPKALDILRYVKQKSKDTGIIAYNEMQTNLTFKTELLDELLPLCDQFNVSLHYLELRDRDNKLEAFTRNFDKLKELGVPIHNFDVMLENVPDEYLEEFYTYIKNCLSYDKIINSEMIYGFCHYAYNEETAARHLEFYKNYNKTEQQYCIDGVMYNTNDLFKKGIDNRGWHCAAGTQSITINGDGNVYHCGIHMTNYLRECIDETPYTNLVTEAMAITKMSVLYKSGTRCRWDYCGGDFYLSRKPFNQS
jgi:MoaA/NifB/PqqE/SkfB family radical SAM enzyme